jgi:hypothetical protein
MNKLTILSITIIESEDSAAILASNCKYLNIINIQVSGSGRLVSLMQVKRELNLSN